jgi:hypothetical protein
MALPKKGRRTILIRQKTYHWVASGNDGYILLVIERAQQPMLKLLVQVDYEDDTSAQSERRHSQTTVISSSLVRRAIEHALSCGWSVTPYHVLSFSYQKGTFTQRMPF